MKKLLLSLIAFLGVAMCSVVAYIGLSYTTPSAQSNNTNNSNGVEVNIDKIVPVEKPSTITYAPNTISVQKGGDSINYNYTPDINQKDETTPTHTIAYEYCFGNPMDRKTAVNLKSIDTTGVNVSYYYSTSKIDTTSTLVGETEYTLQEMESDTKVYIYVLVGPEDVTVPTTFTKSIVWYYGIPQSTSIIDNVTGNVISTQTIVTGQKIDENTFDTPENFTRIEQGKVWDENTSSYVEQGVTVTYYFDAWFYDKDFTQIVDGNNSAGRKIYARYHNIDPSKTEYWGYSDEGYTFSSEEYYSNNWYSAGYDYCKTTGILHPVIPTTYNDGINGKANVVGIGDSAFNNYPGVPITRVSLPVSLTSIGIYAFSDCSSLTSIDLSGCTSLTSIGENVFSGCSSLTSIDLSGCTSLTSIGESAFYYCSSLTSIDLSGCTSLTSIGTYAFSDCSSLTSIDLSGCTSLTSIGDYAFSYCSSLTSITIPSSLTSIGTYAFYWCDSLTSIDLSRCTSLTSIGESAFEECGSLTSITIPSSVTSIPSSAFMTCFSLKYNQYDNCKYLGNDSNPYMALITTSASITSCEINSNTKIISNSAFSNCGRLTSITIPSSVTSIGDYAFNSCYALAEIYNLSSLSITIGSTDNGYVGYYAKVIHTSLTEPSVLTTIGGIVYYPESASSYTALTVLDKTVTSVTLDSRTTAIEQHAFYSSSLTSITIPEGVTSIGAKAFASSRLKSITIPEGVTSIGEGAFSSCTSLTSITIPEGVTSIEKDTFWWCHYLTKVTLPSTLTSIGEGAFENCGLTSITIPEGVTSIGDNAFHYCDSLTSITIPEGVTSIGEGAFEYCEALTSITIPSSVTKIGRMVFYSCDKLTSITFEDTSTWYKTSSSSYTGGSVVDVTNPTQNATWLRSTRNYYNYYWYKV